MLIQIWCITIFIIFHAILQNKCNFVFSFNMFCSKFNIDCPDIELDSSYIFVMMPFNGFNSVYDTIKQAIASVPDKKFNYDRADDEYTHHAIWCERICRNIRRAKYCIVDTTGKNPNVYYELGYAHALGNAMSIIITQKIEDAPFDVRDFGHILYNVNDLPKLRDDLKKALIELENRYEKHKKEKPMKELADARKLALALKLLLTEPTEEQSLSFSKSFLAKLDGYDK